MKEILIPALTGQFEKWRYYQITMKVENLVENLGTDVSPNYRVKTIEEVKEIYEQRSVRNMLQRVFDPNRLKPIKEYLIKQKDSYINNLTIAIFEGNPEWLPMQINHIGKEDNLDTEIEKIGKTFGIIKLKGDETLFILDGQHRLKGLREAIKTKSELKEQEVCITLISHKNNLAGRIRTRRLFSTINRHAVPVSEGENILLDEDDASAIFVRDLIEEYTLFKDKEIIALNKTANLNRSDRQKLTTVISLWNINEIVVDNSELYSSKIRNKYVRVRPNDKLLEKQKEKVFTFWDTFFDLFPVAKDFVENPIKNIELRENGGPYYLRPIGQEIIAFVYQQLININKKSKIKEIQEVEHNLNSNFWKFVLWNPYRETMLHKKTFALYYYMYNFGFELSDNQMRMLKKNYKKNSGHLESDLPRRKYNFL